MGLFDWLGGNRRSDRPGGSSGAAPIVWRVARDGDLLAVEDGRGAVYRVPLAEARSVRVVQARAFDPHVVAQRGGWQVTLARPEGDVLVGAAQADWRAAWDLARLVCDRATLPMDELNQRMFSRVGQFSQGR